MDRLARYRMYVIELTSKWIAHYEIQVIHLTTDRLAYQKLQLYDLTRNQLARSLEQVMCYRIQIVESTSNQFVCSIEEVICYRIQVLESTSNQLARSLEQVTCYRIQVYDLTSNQAMCSVDRLTYHRTQLINLTSNRAICQMPLPCPLTFRASSIKHWIPIQIPPPFHYPNTPYQIPHQVHPHRPKRQSQTTNRLTNPHSICTSTPSKERVQATNNRLLTTLYLYIPSFGFLR